MNEGKKVDMVDEDAEIDFGFIVVDKEDFDTLSELLDFEIDDGIFYDDEGNEIHCEASRCDKLITEDTFGMIVRKDKGTVFYCDSPACFVDFMVYLEGGSDES